MFLPPLLVPTEHLATFLCTSSNNTLKNHLVALVSRPRLLSRIDPLGTCRLRCSSSLPLVSVLRVHRLSFSEAQRPQMLPPQLPLFSTLEALIQLHLHSSSGQQHHCLELRRIRPVLRASSLQVIIEQQTYYSRINQSHPCSHQACVLELCLLCTQPLLPVLLHCRRLRPLVALLAVRFFSALPLRPRQPVSPG